MKPTRTLKFGITGEFITKTAREWFYIEHKPYSTIEELLLSCMCGTDIPEGKLKMMAQDIVSGRSELVGNSWDGTFRYRESEEPPEINLFHEYDKAWRKVIDVKSDNKALSQKFNALYDSIVYIKDGYIEDAIDAVSQFPDTKDLLIDFLVALGKVVVEYRPGGVRKVIIDDDTSLETNPVDTGSPLLNDFFEQKRIEEEHVNNYGWLEPDGTFHPVPWCEHQEYAMEVMQERRWMEEACRFDGQLDRPGDFLTEAKGWVLLHNPGQGVAYVSRCESKMLTKAQREFLFDYFYRRGQIEKAKKYLEEGEC